MRHTLLALSVALSWFCLGTCASLAEEPISSVPSRVELESWLTELDSRKYAEREEATEALAAAGLPAVPYLRQAALGDSLEAADRAVWVLKQFSESTESPLQLAALEVLADTKRFPKVVRDAEDSLAELVEQQCRQQLESLGATFRSEAGGVGILNTDAAAITVNANREEWKGTAEDLLTLTKLRKVSMLRVAARDLEDKQARQLAGVDGLEVLELIESNVSLPLIEELRKTHPQLRVRLKNRTLLGVGLFDGGGAPTVTTVYPNKPAHKAGIQKDDVVVRFAGHEVKSFDDLTTRISQHKPGEQVEIVVVRENSELALTATLEAADWTKSNPMLEGND